MKRPSNPDHPLHLFDKRDLAKACGISLSMINHITTGRRKPKPLTALKIEKYTNGQITKEELLFPEIYLDKKILEKMKYLNKKGDII